MRIYILYFFLFGFFALKAQDKIYFLNGNTKLCKVVEVSTDLISITINGYEENFNKLEIALIEYGNGNIDIITSPTENVIYEQNSETVRFNKTKKESISKENYLSLNCLSLYNADISVFYEHIAKNKIIGVGVMGAYNFNLKVTLPNLFLANLHNAKKNYDLGATLNLYPAQFSGFTKIYFGLMVKYTSFSFDKVLTDSSTIGGVKVTNIRYSHTDGNMLATMLTTGTHTFLNDNFYIRTLVGIGAFKLKGDFKKEFNEGQNKNSQNGRQNSDYNFLPKMYLGIIIGFNF